MQIEPWEDVLESVTSRDVDPGGWRAVAGRRDGGVGEDLYLGHPGVGLYLFKTYAKNPFDVRGVGARVARDVDGDLGAALPAPDAEGRFAVQTPPEDPEAAATAVGEVLETHADAPTSPLDCFEDVMDALESPAFGPMAYGPVDRPDALSALSRQVPDRDAELAAALESRLERDGIRRGIE